MTSGPFTMQRLSTEDVSYRERMAFLHDFVGRHVGGQHFRLLSRDDDRVDLAFLELPDRLSIGRASFPPIHGRRSRDLLCDGRDRYMLTLHHADFEVSIEGKGLIKVPAGGMTMTSEAIHSEYKYNSNAVADVLMLDHRMLARLAPRVELEALYILPPTVAAMPLLRAYADMVRTHPPASFKAGEMAARHLYDLAALLLDGFVRGGADRNGASLAAARLKLVKKDILERLTDHHLQVDAVAQRHRVTTRYVQRLFEMEGTTFSQFVRDNRLDLAFRLLREGALGSATIAAVAHDAGFSDLSTFNRAFRKRFSATPSDVRAAALKR